MSKHEAAKDALEALSMTEIQSVVVRIVSLKGYMANV